MNKKGQGLIEALIALGAAVIIISAITIAVITAVNNSDFSKYQNLATGYAQQGMQVVQQKSQLDWQALQASISAATVWCLPQGTTDFHSASLGSSPCGVNISGGFVRQLNFTGNSASCSNTGTQIEVTVKWTDGKCSTTSEVPDYCHKVTLDTCIEDINRTQ